MHWFKKTRIQGYMTKENKKYKKLGYKVTILKKVRSIKNYDTRLQD